jgi:large conductance mechanosensitive channel
LQDGGHYDTLDAAKGGTAVITYGNLLQATINFVLHCLFLILRAAEKMKRVDWQRLQHLGPTQEDLLIQIRDLLKK